LKNPIILVDFVRVKEKSEIPFSFLFFVDLEKTQLASSLNLTGLCENPWCIALIWGAL
jgi:hypothetical protein